MQKEQYVPSLRFEGFNGEWGEKQLGEVGDFKKTYSFSRSMEGIGKYKHIHYGDIHTKYNGIINESKNIPQVNIPSDKYVVVENNDIIFADASEDTKDLGKVAIVENIETNVISGLHTLCLRVNSELSSYFFLIHTHSRKYLQFMYTKGTGGTVLGISKTNLSGYKFLAPSIKEQEKIANFFSLLDKRISLQQEKVILLKEKKQGLMQQLFSQKLRFKDENGEEYPEWAIQRLQESIVSVNSGKTKDKYLEGEYVVYGSTGVIGYTQKIDYEGEYILIARVGANAGTINLINAKCGISDNTLVVKVVKYINLRFIYYLLLECRLNKLIYGSGQPLLTSTQIKNIIVKIPCLTEQQKIADFLTTLDNKIEKEEKKLQHLREQKKAFIQKMFI